MSARFNDAASELLYAVDAMPSDGHIHIIAAALAAAERTGMERAAEIATRHNGRSPMDARDISSAIRAASEKETS